MEGNPADTHTTQTLGGQLRPGTGYRVVRLQMPPESREEGLHRGRVLERSAFCLCFGGH